MGQEVSVSLLDHKHLRLQCISNCMNLEKVSPVCFRGWVWIWVPCSEHVWYAQIRLSLWDDDSHPLPAYVSRDASEGFSCCFCWIVQDTDESLLQDVWWCQLVTLSWEWQYVYGIFICIIELRETCFFRSFCKFTGIFPPKNAWKPTMAPKAWL